MSHLHSMYRNAIQRHLKWMAKKSAGVSSFLKFATVKPTEIVDCLASIELLTRLHMEMICQLG
jgi:hypothetical protein